MPASLRPNAALLAWFDANKRDLPWRRTKDPYAIWISEVMLQQTRVETVIPYFERFLRRFPDATALAAGPIDDVLGAWSGLGYYRRARGLHACAKEIVARYGGRVPDSVAELRTLPGVGDYTAGAVASIAFGERASAVDGNVKRVIARLLALEGSVETPAAKQTIREACEALQDPGRPGDFNQALMELGATVCTPSSPRCDACPVAAVCQARKKQLVDVIPWVVKRRASPRVGMVAALCRRRDEVLLGRRPLDGLFGGLWEPPCVQGTVRTARNAFTAAGIQIAPKRKNPSVVHVLTHRVLDIQVVEGRALAVGPLAPYLELAFHSREALPSLPMSTLARRLLGVSFADG